MNPATTAPVPDIASAPRPPMVRGLPLIGSTIEMAANPAKFFARCYRDYGSAFRVRVFGNDLTVIAGAEAESGRAHVRTPVTTAPHVCRPLHRKKKHTK